MMLNSLDPPKSPLKRGTLNSEAPLFKGGWGDRMQSFKVFQSRYTVSTEEQ